MKTRKNMMAYFQKILFMAMENISSLEVINTREIGIREINLGWVF